jgi:hypothetical protein
VKYKVLIFGILIVGVLSLLDLGYGLAGPPPMPSSFFGTVKINDSNVPLTTKVSAWINGIKYSEETVIMYNDDTVYSLDVPGDVAGTPEIEGGKPGDTIIFFIGNQVANQTDIWQSGSNTELNLSAFTPSESFKLYLPNISNH